MGKNGQETVKLWMLYQALAKMSLSPGKETMESQKGTRVPAGVFRWPIFGMEPTITPSPPRPPSPHVAPARK
jgi:hypothetical protein